MTAPSRLTATLLIAAVAIGLAFLFVGKVSRKMPDLEVYWTAANRARQAEPLYRAEDGHYQFKYLPAFAVLTIPLGAVSLETARATWFVASLALLALLVTSSVKLMPERRRSTWILVTFTVLVMAKFYGHELVLGQMNALFGVIAVAAALAAASGREAMTGALIAMAIAVKPYAVIFLPWVAARRRFASMAAVVVGWALIFAIPCVVYGVHGTIQLHRDWWSTVTASTAPNLTNADNVSIAAMWAKWIGAGRLATTLAAATSAAALVVAILVFVRRRGVRAPEALECALLLTLIPLLSPQGWDYVFLISTPAIMLLVNYDDRLPGAARILTRLALATIGLSLYDVMGRSAYAIFMSLSTITVCYFILIGALYILRARAIA
ncbi:MAG: glycosyltransferase family 87 protein [Vicinamibacterales bacterium]